MRTRGRIPPFFVLFLCALAFVGLGGFQIVRERRIASANLNEKQFQLDTVFHDLKEEVALAHEREKERDLAEQKRRLVQDSLHEKELELQTVRSQHERTLEELAQAKKILKQKNGEIVIIRSKLQEYSFGKARESAEQITSKEMESAAETRDAEGHDPADKAGLDDRKSFQDEEEAAKEGSVSATEMEMHERNQPKDHLVNVLKEGGTSSEDKHDHKAADKNLQESFDMGGVQEAVSEQDTEDIRDLDEKDMDANEDLHEMTKIESDLQTGNHEDADAQEVDHGVE